MINTFIPGQTKQEICNNHLTDKKQKFVQTSICFYFITQPQLQFCLNSKHLHFLTVTMYIGGQLQALRQYVTTLQRQNQAKAIERETIYRQLDSLQSQLKKMDRLYQLNKQFKEQIKKLQNVISDQTRQIEQMNEVYVLLQAYRDEVNRQDSEKTNYHQEIGCLKKNYCGLVQENQRMLNEIQKLENQIRYEKQQNEKLALQSRKWRGQIEMIAKKKQRQTNLQKQKELYSQKLEELASNYFKLQSILIQKQRQNVQLNQQLSQVFHQLQKQGQLADSLKASLNQKQIMIDCLESKLQQLKVTYGKTEESPEFAENISKLDLIKQANILVQRVNFLEKQNRGDNYTPPQSSKSLLNLQELQIKYFNLLQSLAL